MANKEQGQRKESKKKPASTESSKGSHAASSPEPPKSKKEAKKEARQVAIKSCTCRNPYQDKRYGSGKRVMNPLKNTSSSGPYHRCTVCGKEQ